LPASRSKKPARSFPANAAAGLRTCPFTESKEAVGGYFLIRAKDLDEAVELSRTCPILANGGEI